MLLARRAVDAAKRLIELTKCDQSETARKACLDIITARNPNAMKHVSSQEQQATNENVAPASLSPEAASRILAILARTRRLQRELTQLTLPRASVIMVAELWVFRRQVTQEVCA